MRYSNTYDIRFTNFLKFYFFRILITLKYMNIYNIYNELLSLY